MANTLPERANLSYLRKQAKDLLQAHRSGDPDAIARLTEGKGTPRLHDVQRALAREYGFPSWRQLVEHVESSRSEAERLFVNQAWRGDGWWQSGPASPEKPLSQVSPVVALMSGDVRAVRQQLSRDPEFVRKKLGPKNVEPLLYVCYSGCLQNPDFKPRMLETAKLLLAAGANPDATYAYDDNQNSALSCLYGAAGANGCPELTRMLLEAGANPDDGESLYHSAEQESSACMELLLSHGVTIEGTNALARLLDYEKPRALRKLLKAGALPHHGELQHAIARGRSEEVISLLLHAGADPKAKDRRGLTPLETAILNARPDLVALLRRYDDSPLSAAIQGIHDALFTNGEPSPVTNFEPIHGWALEMAASRNDVRAIERLLAIGVDPNSVEPFNGGTALHGACFNGNVEAVRALLAAGASMEIQDRVYSGFPMGWLCVGSRLLANPKGDFVGVAKLLIEAGHRYKSEESSDDPPFGTGARDDVQEYLRSIGAIWNEHE